MESQTEAFKEKMMQRALDLAKRGEGRTSPNPMVGCVVVKDGRIISEGFHEHLGGFHAERNALTHCPEDPAGADLYVTLEPCCHTGRTPPCTDIIIEKKIARVFVGAMDVNPIVAGKGVRLLREAGIEVETGILEAECHALNEVFEHYMTEHLPFVDAKYAMTADGKIATAAGDARWVSSEVSLKEVHRLRKHYKGIMCGIGTVLQDDPMLNCRIESGVDPIRLVCDTHLRIPMDSKLVQTAKEIPTWVLAGPDIELQKKKALEERGVEVLSCGLNAEGHVDLSQAMQKLAEREVDGILLEGGGTLMADAFAAHLVNKVHVFVAPKIVGGEGAKSPVGGKGIEKMNQAIQLGQVAYKQYGPDICLTGCPVYEK
ncbi:MAG: bifunctional diaminohydroxyphosphoribosylaminopyrimidine deaminase/5-amino-6-(5-phosphoribosylamino)uracil reductase RibD [Pseudoramibacter sp.]